MPCPSRLRHSHWAVMSLALAGCHVQAHDDNGEDASITIENGGGAAPGKDRQTMSVDVPGFSAKVNVPDLDIGGDTRIEDMPLYPGTRVNGVNISAQDGGGEDRGDVTMAFTAPAGVARVIAWYGDQARRHGWTVVPATGENQFEADKPANGKAPIHFALQVASATGGSSGRFIVTGR